MKVTREVREREVITTTKEPVYVIELTEREAVALRTLIDSAVGGRMAGPRGMFANIADGLGEGGVTTDHTLITKSDGWTQFRNVLPGEKSWSR